jgi:glycosyltransferase involved in cell wall biosynthesis
MFRALSAWFKRSLSARTSIVTAGGERLLGDRLRLLHVIHTLDPTEGGAVKATTSMCAALAEHGHDVALYATGPTRLDQAGSYQTRIFPVQFAPMAVSFGFVAALRRLREIDLVHIHQIYRFPQAAAAAYCRRHGIPYCVQPHGSLEPMLYYKRERRTTKRLYEMLVENRNLRKATGLIYTAEGERNAVDFLHLPPPAFIVPNGLHLSEFSGDKVGEEFRARYGLEGKELIAWMGRLVPVKGLDLLCKAFAIVAAERPQAVLVLVGPDTVNYRATLHRLIRKLGIAERVIFTDMLQGREKLAVLNEADIFVLPSHTENFGLAAMEAMAMGCPVILSHGVKISPEMAAAGAGRAVAYDIAELSGAIRELLSDGGVRRTMAAAARTFAQRFDWTAVVGRLEQAYTAMIGAKRP